MLTGVAQTKGQVNFWLSFVPIKAEDAMERPPTT
jgi:hypothetical protein